MNKSIIYLFCLALLPGLGACKKKNTQPEEYFSFDADGVHYEYPQEKGTGFTGNWETLGAGTTSASVGYIISAYSRKDLASPGRFTFYFGANHIPTKDTFILGEEQCSISIEAFKDQGSYYEGWQEGQIIFTERSATKLSGTFSFKIEKNNHTDTLIITNGKFSILP